MHLNAGIAIAARIDRILTANTSSIKEKPFSLDPSYIRRLTEQIYFKAKGMTN